MLETEDNVAKLFDTPSRMIFVTFYFCLASAFAIDKCDSSRPLGGTLVENG